MLFDTNVLLDIATADPIWSSWSELQLRMAAAQGPIQQSKHDARAVCRLNEPRFIFHKPTTYGMPK